MSSWSGWMVETMSRIGPDRGRSISLSRIWLTAAVPGAPVLGAGPVKSSSSNAVSSPPEKPNRRRCARPIGSAGLAR